MHHHSALMVRGMREELVNLGFKELRTPEEVESELNSKEGTNLLVFNSVCGCSAGGARPGVRIALEGADSEKAPQKLTTVFAGQDPEATAKAREYIDLPPSSPSMALFKDGQLAYFMPRDEIEGYSAEEIAQKLQTAFQTHC